MNRQFEQLVVLLDALARTKTWSAAEGRKLHPGDARMLVTPSCRGAHAPGANR